MLISLKRLFATRAEAAVTKKRRDDVKGQMNSEKRGYLGHKKSELLGYGKDNNQCATYGIGSGGKRNIEGKSISI